MVVAVAKAAEAGARAIVCASTGNTSASAAAYGAAAGLEVIVVLPKGQIAVGKLLQALVAGARVVAIDGNFDQALGIVRALAEQDDHPVTLVNSVNPFRLEGQKTAAFEICDDLGRAPDVLAIPVGNAGNISAYWAGFREYAAAGLIETHAADVGLPGGRRRADRRRPPDRAPRDHRDRDPDRRPGVVGQGDRRARRVGRPDHAPSPTTRSWPPTGRSPRYEGIFCEPASAASVAGVTKAAAAGELDPAATVVCVLTGHGLKDPTTAERQVAAVPRGRADRRLGRRRARLVGDDDGRPLARRARRQPGHGRGAGLVGQPRRRLRLPRARPRHDQPDRARGPRLEPRRDRADRRRRGPQRADRGSRQPVRARPRGDPPGRPRRPARGRRLADRRCTTRSRWRAASARPRPRRSAASWPATPSPARRCRRPSCSAIATRDRGPSRQRRGRPARRVRRVGAPTPGGVEAIRFDAPRDLRAILFIPDLRLSTDEMRARAARDGPARRRGRQPRARSRSAWPGWRPAATTCSRQLTVDRLHEPYRAAVYPQLPAMVEAAREAGALGACLSGAGSTILAFTDSMAGITRIEAAYFAAAADLDLPGRVVVVEPRNAGRPGRQPGLTPYAGLPTRPDEREDLVPGRRAGVGELGGPCGRRSCAARPGR